MNYAKELQRLSDKRKALVEEGKQLLASADTLTDDMRQRDDAIHAEIARVEADIDRYKRLQDAEKEMGAVATVPGNRIDSMQDRREHDPMRGFADMADFALAVRSASRPGGVVDERLRIGAAPTNYHQETGTAEGYMVPPQAAATIWELVFAESNLLAEVDSEPTGGNSVEKIKDESTPWGSTGVKAYWRAEGGQMTPSKLDTDAATVRLQELYAFVLATEELLEDAPRLNDRLTRKSALAIDWKISQAFFEGTGAGQPLGWFTSSALVTQAKESGQTAATIVAANVAKMWARCIDPGMAIWFVNQDAFPQLMTMTLGQQPIWTPPISGFQNAPGGLLFGRPVRFSEHCATLGTVGDIQLVNPKGYYAVVKRNQPTYAESIHLYFDYNIKSFRWTFRVNGQPHLSAAISPNKGSSTRSHFVALATRS